jgi:hypothetical protein
MDHIRHAHIHTHTHIHRPSKYRRLKFKQKQLTEYQKDLIANKPVPISVI